MPHHYLLLFGIVAAIALFTIIEYPIQYLRRRLSDPASTWGKPLGPDEQELTLHQILELEDDVRKTLIQIAGGVLLVVGLVTTLLQWQTSQDRLFAEAFGRAVEQLGDEDKLAVRLGGIHALGRLASKAEDDHWLIMQILTAFVRNESFADVDGTTTQAADATRRPRADISAVLLVVGARNSAYDSTTDVLDFSGADLRGIRIARGELLSRVVDRESIKRRSPRPSFRVNHRRTSLRARLARRARVR